MLAKIKVLIVATVVALGIGASEYQSTWMERQVVQLIVNGQRGCSATLLGPDGLVLTAGHCTVRFQSFQVDIDGHVVPAKVVVQDGAEDYAILKIAPEDMPKLDWTVMPVPIRERPRKGEIVMTYGYPGWSRSMEVAWGISVGCYSMSKCTAKILATADAHPGNSGGALVAQNGDLVGIVVHRYWGRKIDSEGNVRNRELEPRMIHSGSTSMDLVIPIIKAIRAGEPIPGWDDIKLDGPKQSPEEFIEGPSKDTSPKCTPTCRPECEVSPRAIPNCTSGCR